MIGQEELIFSLIIPVYRNEANIPALMDALATLSKRVGQGFEVVLVVDGSPDRSAELLCRNLPSMPFQSQLLELSRNFGAFSAVRAGLEAARGRYFAVMAADLQEPTEVIVEFFRRLDDSRADIVFGVRDRREDAWFVTLTSNLYWTLYRQFVVKDVPRGGVDIFACNLKARAAVLQIKEPNSSLIAQLFWVGFSRDFVTYSRQKRAAGKSSWTFVKRVRYMLDSVFSYSDLPILAMLCLGLVGAVVSICVGAAVFIGWWLGMIQVQGYTPIMLMIIFFGCSLLFSQGLMGCYLWRTFENSKHRPLTLIRSCQAFKAAEGNADNGYKGGGPEAL